MLDESRCWTSGRVRLRLLVPDDAEALLRFQVENLEHLRPFSPPRDSTSHSPAGQRAILQAQLLRARADQAYAYGVFAQDGRLIGTANLNQVVRGAFQNAYVGYALEQASTGRGLMTEAVGVLTRIAFADLGLHRLQAAIMPHNTASLRVVEKNGFRREGLALRYLNIAGVWRDHALYARLADE